MPLFVSAILLIVLSNVAYHVAQKSISPTVHPLISLLVTYVVALAITLLLLPFFPVRAAPGVALRQVNWASVAVGVTIVGVEIGFLLAYRAGWKVSIGSAVASAAVAVLLLPTGLVLFRERLSASNLVGVLLCVAGFLLAVRR
jgi:drug/metabolite transporter (DMT)-like permease